MRRSSLSRKTAFPGVGSGAACIMPARERGNSGGLMVPKVIGCSIATTCREDWIGCGSSEQQVIPDMQAESSTGGHCEGAVWWAGDLGQQSCPEAVCAA